MLMSSIYHPSPVLEESEWNQNRILTLPVYAARSISFWIHPPLKPAYCVPRVVQLLPPSVLIWGRQ